MAGERPSVGQESFGHPGGRRGVVGVGRRPALCDGTPEQPGGRGRAEQRADAHAAGRLAEDGDVRRVAAEAGDVVAHPPQRLDLVADPVAARTGEGGLQVAQVQEAEGAEPVVERHHHDVVEPRQVGAVVPGHVPGTGHERSAVDPHHDRTGSIVDGGRVDVDDQAVLVAAVPLGAEHRLQRRRILVGHRSEGGGVPNAHPAFDGP